MRLLDLLKRRKPAGMPTTATPVMRELPPGPGAALPGPSSAALRHMLFDAVAKGDEPRLQRLCREYRPVIQQCLAEWLIVPESIRANAAAAEWYQRGLKQLAELAAEDANTG